MSQEILARFADVTTLERALAELERALRPAAREGGWSVRIVGEFSAGKSRLVRELLHGSVAAQLLPISSLEPQTLIPLEITHADELALEQIRRLEAEIDGYDVVRQWDRFPERDDLGPDTDVTTHRLRLGVSIEELVLPFDPDNNEPHPTRLTLIDTPGWNDATRKHLQRPHDSERMVSLVYVVQAARIDGDDNKKCLADAIRRVRDCSWQAGSPTLVVVVTRWPRGRPYDDVRAEIVARVQSTAPELQVRVQFVDFDGLAAKDRDALRAEFWQNVRAGLAAAPSAAVSAAQFVDAEELRSRVGSLAKYVEACRAYLVAFGLGLGRTYNFKKLKAHPRTDWARLITGDIDASCSSIEDFGNVQLAPHVSFAPLWNEVLVPRVQGSCERLLALPEAIRRVTTTLDERGPSLREQLERGLAADMARAQRGLELAESTLPTSLVSELPGLGVDKLAATLIAIAVAQTALVPVLQALEGEM